MYEEKFVTSKATFKNGWYRKIETKNTPLKPNISSVRVL